MANNFSIGPLVMTGMMTLDRTFGRVTNVTEIIGDTTQYSLKGINAPKLKLTGLIQGYGALVKGLQLEELVQNPHAKLQYVTFPANEGYNDGWYYIDSMDANRQNWHRSSYYQFTLNVFKLGLNSQWRSTELWDANAETYTVWTGLTATVLLTTPTIAGQEFAVYETRTTNEGSNFAVHNPTQPTMVYTLSQNLYSSICKVFDTVTINDTNETHWQQVYGPNHNFTGDLVIQNGLIRYYPSQGLTPFYFWSSLDATPSWVNFGDFQVYDSNVAKATVSYTDILKLSSREIRWREIRQSVSGGVANPYALNFSLRMGSRFIRVAMEPITLASNGNFTRLSGAAGTYTNWFNGANTGTPGGGNVAVDPNSNYATAYNTTRKVLVEFIYLTQPGFQPLDSTVNTLFSQSNAWNVLNATTVFFIAASPYDTTAFNITTARAQSLNLAQEALQNVNQEMTIVKAGFHG